jgi:hypothetical protein
VVNGERFVCRATRLNKKQVSDARNDSGCNPSSGTLSISFVDSFEVSGMGIRAGACASPHFGCTACVVYMTVRENQMPDISRIVPGFLHRFEYDSVLFGHPASTRSNPSSVSNK